MTDARRLDRTTCDTALWPLQPHSPFFVRCVGGDLPDVVHDDLAHVLGTPEAAS